MNDYMLLGSRGFVPAPLNLMRVMFGGERPDIHWLDRPYGTFDNVPLLDDMKLEKGSGFNLTSQMWQWLVKSNPDDQYTTEEKMRWLTSNEGSTDMVLLYDEGSQIYRQHTPEVSGGALVNVLEVVGDFVKIECWDVHKPTPEHLPPYLVYVWAALQRDGETWYPRGGIRFPIWYFREWAYLPRAWVRPIGE